MRKPAPFVLLVAVLSYGTALCATPRHPGVAGVGDNPQGRTESALSPAAQTIQNAKDNLTFEKESGKRVIDPLRRPKFNLIPEADISKYRFTERYLKGLGDSDISHYFILQEDYVFRIRDGRVDKIPAGFIWDGASIGKKKMGAVGLEVGNTRYNSAFAEGLIHDYMYRNPQRYTKEESDELFYVNLKRCNNPDPWKMYEVVKWFGGDSYRWHLNNQQRGYYDVFTPEFYAENLKTFQSGNNVSLGKTEETAQQPDLHALDLADPNGDWCKCGDQTGCKETSFMGESVVIFQCPKCGRVNVKFARLALQREKEWMEKGIKTQWIGNRNDAVKASNAK